MTDDSPAQSDAPMFNSGDIARLMWRELDPAVSPEPLTFERVNAALRNALLGYFADMKRQERARTGRKTN